MAKSKTKKILIALASLCLTTVTAFTVAFTTAAFINQERHTQSLTITTDYSKYFGLAPQGVNVDTNQEKGSQANPYFINDGNHLRNLSYLVNLGCFDENDYFIVPSSFDYLTTSKEADPALPNQNKIIPLTPIGTEQSPFISHFEGLLTQVTGDNFKKQAPIISNLYVKATNQCDCGMFGYIGSTGFVGGFILDNPRIIFANPDASTAINDNNPVALLKNEAKNEIFTETILRKFAIKEPLNSDYVNQNELNRLKTFTILPPADLDLNYQITMPGNPHPINLAADLFYESDHEDLLNVTNGVCTIPSDTIVQPSYKPIWALDSARETLKPGQDILVSVGVKAICYDEINNTNYYAKYILERFKVYYDYAKKGYVFDQSDVRSIAKTIYPDVSYLPDYDEEGNPIYQKFDEARTLYAGIICGRLGGVLEGIGVKSPKLDISRPFVSKSILVGKSLDDDNKMTMMKEEFSCLNTLNNAEQNSPLVMQDMQRYMYDYYHMRNTKNGGTKKVYFINSDIIANNKTWSGQGNQFIKNIYKRADGPDPLYNDEANTDVLNGPGNYVTYDSTTGYQKEYGLDYVSQNNIRIYGTNNKSSITEGGLNIKPPDGLTSNKVNVYLNDSGTDYYRGETIPTTPVKGDVQTISLNQPMMTKYFDRHDVLNKSSKIVYSGYNSILASNCLYFWVTSKHDKGKARKNSNGSIEFYLNFEIDYLYFDDNNVEGNVIEGDEGFNKLEVRVAERAIGRKSNGPFSSLNRSVRTSYCGPQINQYQTIGNEEYIQHLDVLPHIDQAPGHSATANINNTYPFAYVNGPIINLENNSTIKHQNPLVFNQRSGKLSDLSNNPNQTYKVLTKSISIDCNKELVNNVNRNKHQVRRFFFPCFYIGFPTPANYDFDNPAKSNYRLDILGMRVTLSNKKGNSNPSLGSIDFLKDTDQTLPIRNSNFLSGKSKIGARTITNFMEDSNIDSENEKPIDVSPFLALKEGLIDSNNNYAIKHYTIFVEKTAAGITVTWNYSSTITLTPEIISYITPYDSNDSASTKIIKSSSTIDEISLIAPPEPQI